MADLNTFATIDDLAKIANKASITPFTNDENQRFHMHSEVWSGDVQTILYDENSGKYDVYYLKDGTMIHRTTNDFINFSKENDAVPRNGNEDFSDVWTGSIITNDGTIKDVPSGAKVFYFSGLKRSDGSQNIYARWSNDNGYTFSNQINNDQPLITTNMAANNHDMRDPFVGYVDGKMVLYNSEGNIFGVYKSTDGVKWDKQQTLDRYSNFWPVECPVIRLMSSANGDQKAVLFFSAQNEGNPSSSTSYYLVGKIDSNGIFVPDDKTKIVKIDEGTDFYAGNYSGTPDLRKSQDSVQMIAWIGNWGYTASDITRFQDRTGGRTKRQASYSSLRNISFDSNWHITNKPVFENLNGTIVNSSHQISSNKQFDGNGNQLADFQNDSTAMIYNVNLQRSDGSNYDGRTFFKIVRGNDNVLFNIDNSSGWYMITRNGEELANAEKTNYGADKFAPFIKVNGGTFSLSVVTDNSSIELFMPDGTAYTVASYAEVDSQRVLISAEDDKLNKIANISRKIVMNGGTING